MKFETTALTTKGTPRKVPRCRTQELYDRFMVNGSSYHSGAGTTLAPLLNLLVKNRVPFTLGHDIKYGYFLRKGCMLP